MTIFSTISPRTNYSATRMPRGKRSRLQATACNQPVLAGGASIHWYLLVLNHGRRLSLTLWKRESCAMAKVGAQSDRHSAVSWVNQASSMESHVPIELGWSMNLRVRSLLGGTVTACDHRLPGIWWPTAAVLPFRVCCSQAVVGPKSFSPQIRTQAQGVRGSRQILHRRRGSCLVTVGVLSLPMQSQITKTWQTMRSWLVEISSADAIPSFQRLSPLAEKHNLTFSFRRQLLQWPQGLNAVQRVGAVRGMSLLLNRQVQKNLMVVQQKNFLTMSALES